MAQSASDTIPWHESESQALELARLRRLLDISAGTFSLSIVECNSPALRGFLIDRILADQPGVVVVSLPPGCVDIYGEVIGRAEITQVAALFVTEIELSILSGATDYPALRSLNASRDLWESRFSCPVVFWMPAYVAALLPMHAPDLWRYQSHRFEFPDQVWNSELRSGEEFSGNVTMLGNLDVVQQQSRIAELEQRIRSLQWPPPDSLFHFALASLSELGYLCSRRRNFEEAETYFDKALELCVGRNWEEGAAVQHGNLGNIAVMRGDLDRAERHYRTALGFNERYWRLEGQATNLGNLGIIERRRGNLDVAERYSHLALEKKRQGGQLEEQAADLGNLGLVAIARSDLDTAWQYFRDALAINQQFGRLEGEAIHLLNLGNILLARGDLSEAERHYRESLVLNQRLGRVEGEVTCIGNLASLAELRGDQSEARALWSNARELSERFGMSDSVAKAQRKLDTLQTL